MTALRDLFSSKKFITLIIGLAVAGGAYLGLNVDPKVVASILGAFAILIHAQGQADHGKEAAKITAGIGNLPASLPAATAPSSSSTSTPIAALVLIALALGTTQSACTTSARATTLHTTMTGLTVASDAFATFDAAYQTAIASTASDEATGIAKLTAYKVQRDRVVDLFAAAYRAVAAAAVLNADPKSVAAAVTAAGLALDAWSDLKGAL